MWCGSAWFSHPYRTKLRAKYQLPEKPCSDFHAHCLLSPCALCQEYRELELRGVDMGEFRIPHHTILHSQGIYIFSCFLSGPSHRKILVPGQAKINTINLGSRILLLQLTNVLGVRDIACSMHTNECTHATSNEEMKFKTPVVGQ
jgi:hypothetical protein